MTASKILFFLCLFFTAGIFINSIYKMPQILSWGILIVSVILISFSFFIKIKKNLFLLAGFCFLFLVLGISRMQITEFNIAENSLAKLNGQDVVIEGFVSNEPDIRDNFQKIKVKTGNSTVLVNLKRYPEYKYLDKLKLSGRLQEPQILDEFNYKNYLMKDGIYSVMNFPKAEFLGTAEKGLLSIVYSKILYIKQEIRESIRKNFLPPESSILEGTIIGDNAAMSSELKDKLNITGLRHIIAVSGTHVIIISAIIMALLIALGLWRGQAFYIAVVFIIFYIFLTGLPASGVRAGIMGILYLLAQKLGRQTMGPRVVVIACAVMLFINPLLLFYDVGFQLSFMAVLGLIYLEPLIKKFFESFIKRFLGNKKKEKKGVLIGVVSATLSAQIFTMPIMVFNFGNISFVSPVTNFLIFPIVEPLMILGFLCSFLGIFFGSLSLVLAIPCHFLLQYFIFIINFFSNPWAVKNFENIHWAWLFASYILIAIIVRYLNKKYSKFIV